MTYLLHTNVLSEARKQRPDPNVITWLDSVSSGEIFLSVLTVGEIRQGIERLRRKDSARAAGLDEWLAGLRSVYADRIIGVDVRVAEEWGRLNGGDPLPVADGLLAATAKSRGWTLVTRDTGTLARCGVALLNPFDPAG